MTGLQYETVLAPDWALCLKAEIRPTVAVGRSQVSATSASGAPAGLQGRGDGFAFDMAFVALQPSAGFQGGTASPAGVEHVAL
jgi:hypothetical protein